MNITAGQVKELRERTGVGMMECKKALVEAGGDIDAAIEFMRKSGMAKAAKKASRVAAEGVICVKTSSDRKQGVIIEINSETDFVARDDNFKHFAEQVTQLALKNHAHDVTSLLKLQEGGVTLEELRQQLVAKIGENINVRRINFVTGEAPLTTYVHSDRIGVIVSVKGGDETLAKDIALHIAAMKPQVLKPEQVSAEAVEKEKEIFSAQAQESGKPADIVAKMIDGRIKKFVNEVSLTGQAFVKDPNITVGKLLQDHHASVISFVYYEVGEGIEKKEENFRDEVMAQVKGSH